MTSLKNLRIKHSSGIKY